MLCSYTRRSRSLQADNGAVGGRQRCVSGDYRQTRNPHVHTVPLAATNACARTHLTLAFIAGDVSCRGAQYSAVYAARLRRSAAARSMSRASTPTAGTALAPRPPLGWPALAPAPNAAWTLQYGPGAEQSTPKGAASTGSGTAACVRDCRRAVASRWALVADAAHGRRVRDSCQEAFRGRLSMLACCATRRTRESPRRHNGDRGRAGPFQSTAENVNTNQSTCQKC